MKLSNEEINEKLENTNWEYDGESIFREYEFENFVEAIKFVNKISKIAEEQDHHPNIDIKYNKVKVSVNTHSENGITKKDFLLASTIDK